VTRWLGNFDAILSVLRKTEAPAREGKRPALGRLWTALAHSGAAMEEGTWTLKAYACAGKGVAPPPRVTPLVYSGRVREVVIDTDMGADDWMAIVYLLQRPDVHVRAITVAGTGLAHFGPGVRNARALLALVGKRVCPWLAAARGRCAETVPFFAAGGGRRTRCWG
jgi:hypothetical protein